jgi:murein L,D-transpeptidase YcbB/YkuD
MRRGARPRRRSVATLALACALSVLATGTRAAEPDALLAAALAAEVAARQADPGLARDRDAVHAFYAERSFSPAWFDASGRANRAREAIDVLDGAEAQGLDRRDYAIEAGPAPAGSAPADVARREVALTVALFRFLEDLHSGRVAPQVLHPQLVLGEHRADVAALTRAALASDAVHALPERVAPSFTTYARLRRALDRYRTVVASGATPGVPPVAKLEPGARYAGVAALAARLRALGDLESAAALPAGNRYAGTLVDAVKRFQSRHGLTTDGVLGPATFAALNVPLEDRMRQIELTLERLRWLPPFPPRPIIVVDIPAFRLWAFDDPDDAHPPALAMDVIVGKAMETRTPVFVDTLRAIEFSPYWNVPTSIATKELLPRLRRDSGYFAREGFELLGTGVAPVDTLDAAGIAALEAGTARLRQRPGPRNPMGRIKFVLPNNLAIFLHDTSARGLFARTRRDLSHGCIRVAEPVALARFALAGATWDEARIRAAMAAGTPSRVPLARPVTVLVFYATALVDAAGQVHFFSDIYGHDRALAAALAGRAR